MSEIDSSIENLIQWTKEKLEGRQEPPWAVSAYEQLMTALVAVQRSRKATITLEGSLQSELPLESDRTQGANIVRLDSVRRHRDKLDLSLPM